MTTNFEKFEEREPEFAEMRAKGQVWVPSWT